MDASPLHYSTRLAYYILNTCMYKIIICKLDSPFIFHSQVAHTNPHQPTISLKRRICYPDNYKLQSTATQHGCQHAKDAIGCYKIKLACHNGFIVKPCGFFVDKSESYLGASPDGLVSCDCCVEGVLEVKCPHSARV